MKKIFAVILAVMLVSTAFIPASAKTETPVKANSAVGMDISGMTTTDLSGNPVDGSIFQYAVVTVMNYWATWCGPCLSEMPHFSYLHNYYVDTPEYDVQIYGIVVESNGCTPASAQAYLNSHNYTWPNIRRDSVLIAAMNASVDEEGYVYIPETLIVDRHGIVRDHIIGSFSSQSQLVNFVNEWYETLLEEEGPVDPPEPEPALPGDFDGDNELTITDALGLLRIYMGLVEAPEGFDGDANSDGVVDLNDALFVLRVAMGLIQLD